MTTDSLKAALEALPVRTEIINVDTGEKGRQSVELPLELRDAILAALRASTDAAPVAGALRQLAVYLQNISVSLPGNAMPCCSAYIRDAQKLIEQTLQSGILAHPPVPDAAGEEGRPCTCHPSERPSPCQHRYALTECLAALAQPPAAEPVASHEVDADGKPTDDSDPWFQLGWHKERLTEAESELATWKERAMSLRLSNGAAEPVGMREALDALEAVGSDQALREACEGIADDYMTSETHHPGYVLIPTAKFEQIVAATERAKEIVPPHYVNWHYDAAKALATGNGGEGRS